MDGVIKDFKTVTSIIADVYSEFGVKPQYLSTSLVFSFNIHREGRSVGECIRIAKGILGIFKNYGIEEAMEYIQADSEDIIRKTYTTYKWSLYVNIIDDAENLSDWTGSEDCTIDKVPKVEDNYRITCPMRESKEG